MSFADQVAEAVAGQTNVELLAGVFVAADGVRAVVDVGNSRVTVSAMGFTFPAPGSSVWLLRVGKQFLMLGSAAPRHGLGRVTATGSPRCTVEYPAGSGVTQLMGYPSNITPAVNDVVLIDWSSSDGTIIDKITIAPGVVVPVAPPAPAPTVGSAVFNAGDSGTFYVPGGRWNTLEVWAVTTGNNVGAWFYGNQIRDTIPDTATITSAEIYLPLFYDIGSAPVAQVHTSASKPGGNVAVTGGTHSLSPRAGWSPIPAAFIDHMKVHGGGIALVGGGWAKYRPVGVDGASGALRVSWTA